MQNQPVEQIIDAYQKRHRREVDPAFVQWPGNRPGTDHQTYHQQTLIDRKNDRLEVIVLGANTIATPVAGDYMFRYRASFEGFHRTGRQWDLNGVVYDIRERVR